MFGGWSIFGAPNSNNTKGRGYLYKIFLGGPGIIVKQFRQAMGVTVIFLVEVFLLMKKSWLLEQPVGIKAKQFMHFTEG